MPKMCRWGLVIDVMWDKGKGGVPDRNREQRCRREKKPIPTCSLWGSDVETKAQNSISQPQHYWANSLLWNCTVHFEMFSSILQLYPLAPLPSLELTTKPSLDIAKLSPRVIRAGWDPLGSKKTHCWGMAYHWSVYFIPSVCLYFL